MTSLLKHGQHLDIGTLNQPPVGEPRLRVYSDEGQFLGIWRLAPEGTCYEAEKVLASD
jgi:hypothetical protein